jgi:hypothetical protein
MTKRADDYKLRQQQTDAEFLARNFDMSADEASKLVAGRDADAEALGRSLKGRDGELQETDKLAGAPVPSQPKTQYTKDVDEQARKPVLNRRNDRSGGG